NLGAVLTAQPPDDGAHIGMHTPTVGVVVELAAEITGVKASEPGRKPAIALPIQAVAGGAGIGGPAVAAAKRDHLARGAERRVASPASAAAKHYQREKGYQQAHRSRNCCHNWRFPNGKDDEWGLVSL